MVPRPLAPARAMRSRTCADVIQPCREDSTQQLHSAHVVQITNLGTPAQIASGTVRKRTSGN